MENNKILQELINQVEGALGSKLSEEEVNEIYQWQKGTALREVTGLPGWEVVLEMFKDYARDAGEDFNDLKKKDPFKAKDELAVKHNYAYTADRIITALIDDISNAVEFSDKPPDVIRRAANKLKSVK